jgi:hypothetical protein
LVLTSRSCSKVKISCRRPFKQEGGRVSDGCAPVLVGGVVAM